MRRWTQTDSLAPADLTRRLQSFEEGVWTLRVAGAPGCAVDVYHFEYDTVGGKGERVTASSALMVPRMPSAASRPCPIAVALHGTMPDKEYNLANLSGTNPASGRAIALAAVYASHGYIVVAPNYTGLDTSDAPYQSYLDAQQQTTDVLDALASARALLATVAAEASGKVFLVGYSQGGWLTMATHREMERRGLQLTASSPASGPYALAALVDDNFLGRPVCGATVYFPLAIRSYQEAYGNIYQRPEDVYSAKYAKDVPAMLPSTTSHAVLMSDGKLPKTAIFNSSPNVAVSGASAFLREALSRGSPARGPERFASIYAAGFGEDHLLADAFRTAYLADIEAHPDGSYPVFTTGTPPDASRNGLRQAVIKNDLRNFTPVAPMLLCGGQGDGATPFRLSAELMMRYWAEPRRAPKPGVVALLDFEAKDGGDDPFEILKRHFKSERDAYLASQSWPEWVDAYHQFLLPRYCYLAARQFFDTLR